MSQAFTPGLMIKRVERVRRLRELPVRGEILVSIGDVVRPQQVIGRALLQGDLHILRVAEKLGIEPHEVQRGLQVALGDVVAEGQLLCEHAGLFGLLKSRFISPVAGVVELVGERNGHLGVRLASKPIELRAYVAGTVVDVLPEKSVVIEARGAFIQGIFGVGGERHGRVKLVSTASDFLEPSDVSDSIDLQNLVLISARPPSLSALRSLGQRGISGLVCGSVDDQVLAGFLGYDLGIALTGDEAVPFTLIITEGFGSLTMATRTLKLLSEFDGFEVSINGATQVRAGAVRPEILIPHPGQEDSKLGSASPTGLEVGAKIRLIRVPYFGRYAVVSELPHEVEKIGTGAFARVLRAKLDDGQLVTVPRANVELV